MAKFLYRVFIGLYSFVIRLISPFNQKAKLWILGRKGIFQQMRQAIAPGASIIWMHCSSLGEFEQGRPLIEKLRISYPAYKILITFFSPSGYEVRKNFAGADYIFYLPMDSKNNAKTFYEIVNPQLIVFVKYEFWYYYLYQAKRRNISLLLISAVFRKNQIFFRSYGNFYRKMLLCFSHLFVQNNDSVQLLHSINVNDVSMAGDTRFDRVVEIAENFEPVPSIESFCSGSDIIVAGSTWTEDDKELAHYANNRSDIKFIIAPHSIIKDRLEECLMLYKHAVLFSCISVEPLPATINTIIIDNIGMLSRLYKYATIAFIGGGFGADGIHNALEAAVYGKPLVFGPEYEKFIEAEDLVENGAAISVDNALELEAALEVLLKKDKKYDDSCKASHAYVYSHTGSTEKILQYIQEKRLLTN